MNMTIGNKIKPNLDKWQIFGIEREKKREKSNEHAPQIWLLQSAFDDW